MTPEREQEIRDDPDHADWEAVGELLIVIDELRAILRESRRVHMNTFNGHTGVYCQTFVHDNRTGEDGPCTCGADEWNARVDAALGI